MFVQHLPEVGLAHGPPSASLLGLVELGQRNVGLVRHVGYQPGLGVGVEGPATARRFRYQRASMPLLVDQVLTEQLTPKRRATAAFLPPGSWQAATRMRKSSERVRVPKRNKN